MLRFLLTVLWKILKKVLTMIGYKLLLVLLKDLPSPTHTQMLMERVTVDWASPTSVDSQL